MAVSRVSVRSSLCLDSKTGGGTIKGRLSNTDPVLCLDSKTGGGTIDGVGTAQLPWLCLDSKTGGGTIGGRNPLAERGLPKLYLLR